MWICVPSPTPDDAKKLKDIAGPTANINMLLKNRESLIDKNGRVFGGTQAGIDLDQNTAALQLEIKNAQQTGALDTGSIKVLNDMIGDPVIGWGRDNNMMKLWGGKDTTSRAVKNTEDYIGKTINNAATARGYQAIKPNAQSGFKFIGVE